jgi:hypothetical protein
MQRMSLRKWSKRVGLALLTLVLVAAGVWTASRLLGPTDAQEAALAAMRSPIPPVQRNAFPALWLMPYDVPTARREAVFAEDLRRLRAISSSLPKASSNQIGAAAYVSIAATRYPTPAMPTADSERFCRGYESCLAKVEADPAGYTALVERYASLLDRVESLRDHDGLRHSFGLDLDKPFPPYQNGNLARTRHALRFVQGRRSEAFEGVCRSISTWRRIGANSDNLIARMIGSAYGGQTYPALFLEMLARTPREFPLPSACSEAFAPTAGIESSLCLAMRGEFAYQMSAVEIIETSEVASVAGISMPNLLSPLFHDSETTLANGAEMLGHFCRPEIERDMRADRLMEMPPPHGLWRLQCVANALGCVLGEIAYPNFGGYAGRILDANAHLRLIAELLRMRADGTAPAEVAVRLRDVQDRVGSRMRELSPGEDGRTLRMRNYDTRRGEFTEIPLPPYLQLPASKPASP